MHFEYDVRSAVRTAMEDGMHYILHGSLAISTDLEHPQMVGIPVSKTTFDKIEPGVTKLRFVLDRSSIKS